jgi:putative oxidoreductase
MKNFRTVALTVLGTALVAQTGWFVSHVATAGANVAALWRPLAFTTPFVLVAATRGRVTYFNALGRVTIAGAFLLALWNRFDNFAGFVRYTRLVLSFMPPDSIPVLAVAATACEVSLCIAMFMGIKTRFASAGAAVLLLMFATAMVISGLSQFGWAVYVLSAGAFMLSTADASFLSLDSILEEKDRRSSPAWEARLGR